MDTTDGSNSFGDDGEGKKEEALKKAFVMARGSVLQSLVETDVAELKLDTQGKCGAGGSCGAGGCCYNAKYSDHYTCAASGDICCYTADRMVIPLALRSQCKGVHAEKPADSSLYDPSSPYNTPGTCGAGGRCGTGGCCFNDKFSDHYVCAAQGDVCCYDKNREVFPLAECSQCSGVHCEKAGPTLFKLVK